MSSHRSQNIPFSFDCKVGAIRWLQGEFPGRRGCAKERDQREHDVGRRFNQNLSSYHSPKENLVAVKIAKAKEADETARRRLRQRIQNQCRELQKEKKGLLWYGPGCQT